MRSFSIVVAADLANGIGLNGLFNSLTLSLFSHPTRVVCSDKPEKEDPLVALAPSLKGALDLIESLQKEPSESETSFLNDALMAVSSIVPAPLDVVPDELPDFQVDRIFLIGGAQLYDEGVKSADCENIFLTRIHATVNCDTFFPNIEETQYKLLSSSESHTFLEKYLHEPVQGGIIEEGDYKYEYTVYNRI
ncbi:hypothetical protein BGZ80_008455 [Entomortierella chlamydospora]|uniref:Dihydrofolate reductase n=1 Tax=Entomortierella chlamydospora TaxID=101097 RepID=A0A9P6MX83_9FUNG|nr:hypothetical protein BGZ80_008455 [Entomortierella chlamydospora]